jgi:dTDP-4-amino-4,6-dideoxygalactose transaminase
MGWRIPLFDTNFGSAELEAVQAPLRSGWLTMGPYTERLENELCNLTGAKHAIAMSNCTAALHLSMIACGLGPGDEVLCPTLTFVASANAIRYVGATPVFCESASESNLNIDLEDMAQKRTERTKAIVVVHFAGYPVDMRRVVEFADLYQLTVIEDCAHAFISTLDGRKCGTWGAAGCFSFFSNKNVTCGEGGAVVTNDDNLAARLRLLRSHGMTSLTLDRHEGRAISYDVVDTGYNYRIDEMRANLLLAQLERLEEFLAQRRRLTVEYRRQFEGTPVTVPNFDWNRISTPADSVGHHIMPVILPAPANRTRIMTALREAGIQTSIHYPPVHKFSSFAANNCLPRSEGLAARELTLPLYPTMTNGDVEKVASSLKRNLVESAE